MTLHQKHAYHGPLARHRRLYGNRRLYRLMAQAGRLLLVLHQKDVLKTFEVKALYKILFKYLGLLSITIL